MAKIKMAVFINSREKIESTCYEIVKLSVFTKPNPTIYPYTDPHAYAYICERYRNTIIDVNE